MARQGKGLVVRIRGGRKERIEGKEERERRRKERRHDRRTKEK